MNVCGLGLVSIDDMNLEQTGKVSVSGLVTYPVVTILVLLSGGTVQSTHKGGGRSAHAHHR